MTVRVEQILGDFHVIASGLDRALAMLGEADHRLDVSIDAAERGGFVTVAGRLRAAQEDIRQLRTSLDNTHRIVDETASPVVTVARKPSTDEVLATLIPAHAGTDAIRDDLVEARGRLPGIIARVASVADQNPAVGILGAVGQQVLAILLERLALARQNIDAAVADARQAQEGAAMT